MLFFTWKDIPNRGRGLTFDDVLLVPTKSEVRSRKDPSLASRLTRKIKIETPIVSANMDTITESAMALGMHQLGGVGILHRFMPVNEQVRQIQEIAAKDVKTIAASIGVSEDFKERAEALVGAGCNLLTVDIAHGHSVSMIETTKWLKDRFANVEVIAGNVATPEAVVDLAEAGADAIKVGIGPGSMCTTRIITGCGIPQLTAIAICTEAADSFGIPVIADGGLRTSGDIVKAFAAGASTVMLGGMLSGVLETPGEIKSGHKQYRGMASKSAQVSWRGGVPEGMAAEGESTLVTIKGSLRDVILEITGGVRSGMSYLNAMELHEIRERARFVEMNASGAVESRAHGTQSKFTN